MNFTLLLFMVCFLTCDAALTKSELAQNLLEKFGFSKLDAKNMVESFFEEITNSLANGEQVKLSGFGNFDLQEKNERPGRDPKTGKDMPITARRVVIFRPGQKLTAGIENVRMAGFISSERAVGMTKSGLIERLSQKIKQKTAKEVEDAVADILESMSSTLKKNDRIEIRGFGSFSLQYKEPRVGRNPKTGETVELEEGKYVLYFKPAKELKDKVDLRQSGDDGQGWRLMAPKAASAQQDGDFVINQSVFYKELGFVALASFSVAFICGLCVMYGAFSWNQSKVNNMALQENWVSMDKDAIKV